MNIQMSDEDIERFWPGCDHEDIRNQLKQIVVADLIQDSPPEKWPRKTLIEDARQKAKEWAAFDKPVLVRRLNWLCDALEMDQEVASSRDDVIASLWSALDGIEAYLMDRRDNDEGKSSYDYFSCANKTIEVLRGYKENIARDAELFRNSRWADAKRAREELEAAHIEISRLRKMVGIVEKDGRDLAGETYLGMRVAAWREQSRHGEKYGHVYSEHWSTPGKGAINVERLFTESDVKRLLSQTYGVQFD